MHFSTRRHDCLSKRINILGSGKIEGSHQMAGACREACYLQSLSLFWVRSIHVADTQSPCGSLQDFDPFCLWNWVGSCYWCLAVHVMLSNSPQAVGKSQEVLPDSECSLLTVQWDTMGIYNISLNTSFAFICFVMQALAHRSGQDMMRCSPRQLVQMILGFNRLGYSPGKYLICTSNTGSYVVM